MSNKIPKKHPRIFRCPFCYVGDGDIRINVDAFRTMAYPANSFDAIQMDKTSQDVIKFFQGDKTAPSPCSHMLSTYIDVVEMSQGKPVERTGWEFEWDHPWFDVNDENAHLRKHVEGHLYTEDVFDHGNVPPPKTPYRDLWIGKSLAKQDGRKWEVSGRAILALEPERMLNEMLASFQDFESRRKWMTTAGLAPVSRTG